MLYVSNLHGTAVKSCDKVGGRLLSEVAQAENAYTFCHLMPICTSYTASLRKNKLIGQNEGSGSEKASYVHLLWVVIA